MLFERLTENDIKEINRLCLINGKENEGIFFQPWGIPTNIKEHVIYCRYMKYESVGSSCYDENCTRESRFDPPKKRFKVLGFVLRKLGANFSDKERMGKIAKLVRKSSTHRSTNAYADCEGYGIEYVVLSELYDLLKTF